MRALTGAIRQALCASDPADKCRRVLELVLPEGDCGLAVSADPAVSMDIPGRPSRPVLVHPRDVPTRGLGSAQGRAALVHAVAHIEFNAINLALDACWRFPGMPADYYHDWLSVAQDEARHFQMLATRLAEFGHVYGDFPAHNGKRTAKSS